MINQIPFIICGILSFLAKYARAPEMLMAGRFFAGLGAGAGCTYVPVYLTEIAPTKYRGTIPCMVGNGVVPSFVSGLAFSENVFLTLMDDCPPFFRGDCDASSAGDYSGNSSGAGFVPSRDLGQ